MLYNLFSTAVQTKTSVPVNEVLLVQTPFVHDPVNIHVYHTEELNIWFTSYNYFISKKKNGGIWTSYHLNKSLLFYKSFN